MVSGTTSLHRTSGPQVSKLDSYFLLSPKGKNTGIFSVRQAALLLRNGNTQHTQSVAQEMHGDDAIRIGSCFKWLTMTLRIPWPVRIVIPKQTDRYRL